MYAPQRTHGKDRHSQRGKGVAMKSCIAIIAFLCTLSVSCIAQGTKADTLRSVDKAEVIKSWTAQAQDLSMRFHRSLTQEQFDLLDTQKRLLAQCDAWKLLADSTVRVRQ